MNHVLADRKKSLKDAMVNKKQIMVAVSGGFDPLFISYLMIRLDSEKKV